MALSTIQKVVMFSGLVLCVSLLLPKTFLSRGKQSLQQPEGNPGRFPSSVPHGKSADARGGGFSRSHLSEAVSKAKAGGGGGSNSRQSLVGQIIPIYGFGILLYILYILFKLSSKGKNVKLEPKSVPIANGNLKRKITDYELSQLQDKLKETEEAMEKIISRLGPTNERQNNVSDDEEQQLLQRLKEITRVMKEGKIMDGISPEQEAEEAPYMEEWEGYPEETYPVYDPSECKRRHNTILVEPSLLNQPSAEEIAEQMEFMEDYNQYYMEKAAMEGGQDVTTYDHAEDAQDSVVLTPEDEICIEEESDEEEDPAIIAENAGFNSDTASEGEQGLEGSGTDLAVNGDLVDTINNSIRDESQSLRKRSKKTPDC
ncbi:protein RIC-3 [Leptodactylus fuscus]|uniref:protein RIC-3 n=1 Tax=Leptodactylus fuscus TaxID=238119 RepID=UPI003F4E5CDE